MAIIESNDSVSPNSGGFAPEGAKADWTYQVRGEDLQAECLAIVGSTKRKGDGRLTREIPRTHPQLPWILATSIASFRGVGVRDEENEQWAVLADSGASPDLPAVTDQYLRYASYDVRVNFESPAFVLRADDDISLLGGTYFDDSNAPFPFVYAEEWKRFTDAPRHDEDEFIEYKQGQMLFRSTLASPPGPAGAAFPGLVRIPVPKQTMLMTWFRVPESYVLSPYSYLSRFKWRLNQNPWLDFSPGQLLYRGYKILRRSTPPFPDELEGFPGVFSSEKLVDLELNFGICRFACDDAPAPTNLNWIADGWNLFHWAGDRRPHYVTAASVAGLTSIIGAILGANDAAGWTPTYRSCPIELLFTDPDFVQPLGILNVGG